MNDEDYSDMVRQLAKSGEAILRSTTPEQAHLAHMILGIAGEVGEVMESRQQWWRSLTEESRLHLLKELGDMEFYLEGLRQATGVVREAVRKRVAELRNTAIYPYFATTAGNLVDVIKRHWIYEQPIDLERLVTELAWMELHLVALRANIDVTREEVLQANYDKLALRYPGLNYSNHGAKERADESPCPADS